MNKILVLCGSILLLTFLYQPKFVYAQTTASESAKERRDLIRIVTLHKLTLDINQEASHSASSSSILCNGGSYPCVGKSITDTRSADGTGWIIVNLSNLLTQLPIDPLNNLTYHYTYCADNFSGTPRWEIDTKLESLKYFPLMTKDGGSDPNLYEVGTNLNLIAPSGGSCTY